MSKVTYLFGAGASAKCLPVIKDIPGRLIKFKDFIISNRNGSTKNYEDVNINMKEIDIEEDFINECQDLIVQVLKHQSIDTYAKKLRLTIPRAKEADAKYLKLKLILSCFFIYEQLKNPIDDRYDAFFASILKDDIQEFIGDLRIISWNYDFQFEKAYGSYSGKDSISTNQEMLHVFPSTLRLDGYNGNFGIFKLNGTTGFFDSRLSNNKHIYDKLDSRNDKELVKQFMWLYAGSMGDEKLIRPLLSFAWERDWLDETKKLIERVKIAIKDTDVLVIIGYSIPFFNREIDKEIMGVINERYPKIYIQDVKPQRVLEKLPAIWEIQLPKVQLIDEVDQFYLPAEL